MRLTDPSAGARGGPPRSDPTSARRATRRAARGCGRRAATRLLAASFACLALLAATAPHAAGLTLDRVRESGTLRLGYRLDARPFSYQDESGKAAGYAPALCERIVEAVKETLRLPALRTEFTPLGVEESLDAVRQGRIDLLCGATTVTLSRREEVAFSIPTFPSGIGALIREDAPERLRDALSEKPPPYRPRWGASLGEVLRKRVFNVRAGTTAQAWLARKLDELDIAAEVVPVEDYAAGVANVAEGRADALFADRVLLLEAVARSPAAGDLEVLEHEFTYEPLALALERGDEDFRLLVDRTLSRMYASGEAAGIYKTFFGTPDEAALSFFRMTAVPE